MTPPLIPAPGAAIDEARGRGTGVAFAPEVAPGPDDPFAAELALGAPERSAELNRAGVLVAADIHVARGLGQIAGVTDPDVLLTAALAVAATRSGHAYLSYEQAAAHLAPFGTMPYSTEEAWIAGLREVPRLIASDPLGRAPLRLDGARLYLDRYWQEERRLAALLLARNRMRSDVGDLAALGRQIDHLVGSGGAAEQRLAIAVARLRDLTVLAGGPGTGKTTTVAWIVELTLDLARQAGRPEPLIALCAPTGKAAARLQEAMSAAPAAPADPADPAAPGAAAASADRSRASRAAAHPASISASTIHRLLGWLPGGRFRHDARNRLPHDVVIVDETSMVPLSMMVRLVEAVRDDAQLVLVGDPDQLAAIEVGAVLRDIVGPAATAPRFGQAMRIALERVTGEPVDGAPQPRTFGDAVVVLRRGHRSVESISALAEAVRRGDGDTVMAELSASPTGDHADVPDPAALSAPLTLFDPPAAPEPPSPTNRAVVWLPTADQGLDELRAEAVAALSPMVRAARAGDGAEALSRLKGFRLLCAHRRGPYGMTQWGATVEGWLDEAVKGAAAGDERYPGLPLLATRNDYELQLRNGDAGVVVASAGVGGAGVGGAGAGVEGPDASGGSVAVFDTAAGLIELAPSRLADVEPLWAATVYRSQGSEFDVAALVLPEPDSPLLTRELLYTGITRARRRLFLIGSEASVRAAVARPAGRASGLGELLWSPEQGHA